MNESQIIINNINKFFDKIPLIFYIIPFILHIFCTKYLIKKTLKFNKKKTLDDLIFNLSPNLSNYTFIINIIIFILWIPLLIFPKKKYFISIFKYFSIIMLIRSITTCITIIPPSKNCLLNDKNNINNLYKYLNGHCNDKIFSGHTSIMILLFFIIYKNKILKGNYLFIYGLLVLINSFLIICTREHYTIDVILAYIIVISILLILQNL